ncbi:MAG: hypothetical protein WCT18_00525 [Patescibacteria group bacterium]
MVVKKSQGSILLYAVLFVAGILSSGLLISQIITNNIRNAGSLVNSAKAFYSAESGMEKALFELRKMDNIPATEDCEISQICSWQFLPDEKKELRLSLPVEQTVQFDLFNPTGNLSSGTESVSVIWENADAWLEASFYVFEQNEFVPSSPNEQTALADLPVQKMLLNGGSAILNFPQANKNYRLRVKALREEATDLVVKFYPQENLGGDSLPLPNILTIKTVGEYAENTAEVAVVLPRYQPLLGLFDYVLFSESALKK